MPVDLKHLSGVDLSIVNPCNSTEDTESKETSPEQEQTIPVTYTLKRSGGKAPGPKDKGAWRHDKFGDTRVFRSLIAKDIWLTREEYEKQIERLRDPNIPYVSKRGNTVFPKPLEVGQCAWFHLVKGGKYRRYYCIGINGEKTPASPHDDYC